MGALSKLSEIVSNRHDYAKEWKRKEGGKILGYFCTYLAEEVPFAAGILPVRIFGGHEPDEVTGAHIYSGWCPYCRDALAQGLKGRYNYVDGVATAFTCMHIIQAYDSWRKHLPISYSYDMYMPAHHDSQLSVTFLAKELAAFQKSLEGWIGKTITKSALDSAIKVYNTNRELLWQIYETRKSDPPLISGLEAMEMTVSSMLMDKQEHNILLKEAVEEIKTRKNEIKPGIRLMTVGGECDDIEFVKLVESLGANIVIDEQCVGSRYFWNSTIPQEDRLLALATRYWDRPPCPVKDLTAVRRRLPHILKLAQDYKVKGVIFPRQRACDPHILDTPPIAEALLQNNIPSIVIDMDVTMPAGPIKTRVESFLEMLQFRD